MNVRRTLVCRAWPKENIEEGASWDILITKHLPTAPTAYSSTWCGTISHLQTGGNSAVETVRFYKAKGEWLRNEHRRISTNPFGAPDLRNKEQLERLEEFERKWFFEFETVLHKAEFRPSWSNQDDIAETVADGLCSLDGEAYRLDAYSIMSNHVHTVFKPLLRSDEFNETYDPHGRLIVDSSHPGLARIMQTLKGRSAHDCNKILGRTGQFGNTRTSIEW